MKKQNFILPKIYTYHNDLEKQWYVYYSFFDSKEWKMKRFKIFGSLGHFNTVEDRLSAANELCKEYERKLLSGFNPFTEFKKEQLTLSLKKCVEDAIEDRYKRLRKKSKQTYESKIKIFLTWTESKAIDILHVSYFDRKLAIDFLNHISFVLNRSETTVNAYRNTLLSVFSDIQKKGLIDVNPFSDIKKSHETRLGKLPFSASQKFKLKKYMIENDPEMWLFVQFMYYCFIRPGELRDLKCGAIDIDNAQILIDASISKNRKSEYVLIPPVFLVEIMKMGLQYANPAHYIFGKERLPGNVQVGHDYFNKRHSKITRHFGMSPRYTLYSWKHTGAVDAVRADINIKEVQLQLRHADLQTTDIYLKSLGIKDMTSFKDKMPTL